MTAPNAVQYKKPADWQQFQRLCVAVATAHFGINFNTYGRNGQAQGGIDSYAMALDGRLVAVQSKSKDEGYGTVLKPSDVTNAVKKAHEFKPPIDVLIIMTSSSDDRKLTDRALKISQAQLARGEFSVEVWGWQTIEDVIRSHASIQHSFYPEMSPKTSTKQWIARAIIATGLAALIGYGALRVVDHGVKRDELLEQTGLGVKGFVKQSDLLSKSFQNCQLQMERNYQLSSFEFDHYCSTPVSSQLQVMQNKLQGLALTIDPDVYDRMSAMLAILQSYQGQGHQARMTTSAYEGVHRSNMLKMCDKIPDALWSGGLRELLRNSVVQQLQYYHTLRSFIFPSLAAMNAYVMASALEARGKDVPQNISNEASRLQGFLALNQAYHLHDVEFPLSLSAMKKVTAPVTGVLDETGYSASVEADREREALTGGSLTIFYGHHGSAQRVIDCGLMRPGLIQQLEKNERKVVEASSKVAENSQSSD